MFLQALIGKDGKNERSWSSELPSPHCNKSHWMGFEIGCTKPCIVNGRSKPVFTKVNVIFKLG